MRTNHHITVGLEGGLEALGWAGYAAQKAAPVVGGVIGGPGLALIAGMATPVVVEAIGAEYTENGKAITDLMGKFDGVPNFDFSMRFGNFVHWAGVTLERITGALRGVVHSVHQTYKDAVGGIGGLFNSLFGGGGPTSGTKGTTSGSGGTAGTAEGPAGSQSGGTTTGPGGTRGGGVAAGGWARPNAGAPWLQVPGGGPTDTLQAWLTPGEFVVKAAAARLIT